MFVAPSLICFYYIFAGELESAIDWLEVAYEGRDPAMPYIGVLVTYDPLRGEPRFEDLLTRMNLEMWSRPLLTEPS